jgi:hypothetical protein
MIKPRTRKVLLLMAVFTIWMAYEFLGFYDSITTFPTIVWIETIYNTLSLIVAAYLAFRFARRFFEKAPTYREFWGYSSSDRYRVLTNRYFLGLFGIILVYTGLSFLLDNLFFGEDYNHIIHQLKGRSGKVFVFVFIGAFYGYHISEMRKSNQEKNAANYRLKKYKQETDYMKKLIQEIEEIPLS